MSCFRSAAWALGASALLSAAACNSKQQSDPHPPPQTVAPSDAASPADAPPPPPPPLKDFASKDSEDNALAQLGAIPPWQAVIERSKYLARRNATGIIYGTVGDRVGANVQVIDESQGNGLLAVLAEIKGAVNTGDRVVVWGGWHADEHNRWLWRPTRAEKLASRANAKPFTYAPGHTIAEVTKPPKGSVLVSSLKRRGDIIFQVTRKPRSTGAGWIIADRSQWKPIAILLLPGEREPYGGQDFTSSDERWHLERDITYTVHVKPYRKRKDGKLSVMHADSPPLRVVRSKTRDRTPRGRSSEKANETAQPTRKN